MAVSKATIPCSATNNNGFSVGPAGSTGIMWPRGKAQDKRAIGVIDVHGAGARLGNHVDAAGVASHSFPWGLTDRVVAACKPILGQHEAAAGMMVILKASESLSHKITIQPAHWRSLFSSCAMLRMGKGFAKRIARVAEKTMTLLWFGMTWGNPSGEAHITSACKRLMARSGFGRKAAAKGCGANAI